MKNRVIVTLISIFITITSFGCCGKSNTNYPINAGKIVRLETKKRCKIIYTTEGSFSIRRSYIIFVGQTVSITNLGYCLIGGNEYRYAGNYVPRPKHKEQIEGQDITIDNEEF